MGLLSVLLKIFLYGPYYMGLIKGVYLKYFFKFI